MKRRKWVPISHREALASVGGPMPKVEALALLYNGSERRRKLGTGIEKRRKLGMIRFCPHGVEWVWARPGPSISISLRMEHDWCAVKYGWRESSEIRSLNVDVTPAQAKAPCRCDLAFPTFLLRDEPGFGTREG